jgi:hypothetical protein
MNSSTTATLSKPKIETPSFRDPLPETLNGCLEELKRQWDYQQKQDKCGRLILARMQELLVQKSEQEKSCKDETKCHDPSIGELLLLSKKLSQKQSSSVVSLEEPLVPFEIKTGNDAIPVQLRTCNFK